MSESGPEPGFLEHHSAAKGVAASRGRGAASAALAVLLVLSADGFAAGVRAPRLILWDFERGVTNDRGGRYNVYARDPSWARTYLDTTVRPASGGYALRVTVHREKQGFCGVWLRFSEDRGAVPEFIDASSHRFLSFWIKGARGGEDFEFDLVDEAHLDREDSSFTRPLRAYLPKGASTEWQEVLVPLTDFRKLDPARLSHLTLKFTSTGDYRFYLDDVSFKSEEAGSSAGPGMAADRTPTDPFEKAQGAMWVWKTEKLFEGSERAKYLEDFFAFCSGVRLRRLYLSLDFAPASTANGQRFELRNREQYQELLARAHRERLVVEALAGTPEWAARENHASALGAVEAVLAFNRDALPGARFDGVHFDVEPYLLVEYADATFRAELLLDYLHMVSQCVERLRQSGLRFSCDVPAWFYPADAKTREDLTVTFQGVAKTVGEHLTDLLDTVTIMDYRNQADGANGIIAFGTSALRHAASKGARIVVGLETSLEPDKTFYFVCGLPADEFRERLAKSPWRHRRRIEGFPTAAFRDGSNVHVGLEAPDQLEGGTRAAFEKALASVARQIGAASDPERFASQPLLNAARDALRQEVEWQGFQPFEFTDPETQQKIAGFRTVYRMPRKITFHGLGREALVEEARSTIEWLGRYPSFAGLAFHYYEPFRALMDSR